MLLGLQNVTFEFGARTIVEDATWHIQPNERIGLIGYNGTGKSTLLKVLTGQYTPAKGTVEKGRETTIGFLHQDLLGFDTEDSILEVALGAFVRVKELEKELKTEKKRFDKLCKQLRRCTSSFQYENLNEEAEDVRQDIIQLQLIIQDLRRKKQEEELLVDVEV